MSNLTDFFPSGGSEVVAQTLLDHFILLNGDAEALQVLLANDVTPASFATWISGEGKAAKFTQLISSPNGASAIVFSRKSIDAIVNSSVAMESFSLSSVAMTAVAASSVAMTAVAASSVAMTAVFASSTAKIAIYNSNIALSAIQFNAASVQALIAANTGIVTTTTFASDFVFVSNGTRVILLRRFYSSTEYDMIQWARGTTNQGVQAGGRNLDTSTIAVGSVSGSYTPNGTMPTANNATANFVSAANGLRRRSWGYGNSLTVIYALVGA